MPFTPEQLAAVKTVVTHEGCPDGIASAIILKSAFSDRKLDIRFMQYGTPASQALKPEPGMLFCDFSPAAVDAPKYIEAGTLILDHHRTAKPVVESFGALGVFGNEKTQPGVCGASLAFEHIWKTTWDMPRNYAPLRETVLWVEKFARLAGIRDTWQRQSPEWKEACAQAELIRFMGADRLLALPISELVTTWAEHYEWIGDVLLERSARSVQRAIKGAFRFKSDKGTRVIMFDSTGLSSDVAEAVGSEFDLVIGFGYVSDDPKLPPKIILSTRSHTNFDCAAFVSRFGGGGHTKAAGCTLMVEPLETTPNPFIVVRDLLKHYEGSL
jgi:hypothetical protein